MPVQDYSTDPDLNVQISGINIAEGCPPSGINNAIRQLMADVKVESEAVSEAVSETSSALEAYAEAQAQKDAAQDEAIADKLDKSGGTMTGDLVGSLGNNIKDFQSLDLRPITGSTIGGFIDFHHSGDASDYTLRLVEYEKGCLEVVSTTGKPIKLNGIALLTSKGGDVESLSVPQGKLKCGGVHVVRSVNGVQANEAGEVYLKAQIRTLCTPDWTAGVSKSANTSYTAEIGGVVMVKIFNTSDANMIINNVGLGQLTNKHGFAAAADHLFPVDKGDVWQCTGTPGDLDFYPYRSV